MPIVFPHPIQGYVNKIEAIISYVDNGNQVEATKTFCGLIKEIKNIGSYNSNTWSEAFCEKIYDLGKLLANKMPILIEDLRKEIAASNQVEQEILCFIESEILINSWQYTDPRTNELILNISKKYIYNPEFIHDLGHIEYVKKNYLAAINYYNQALNLAPKNETFRRRVFNSEMQYIESFIEGEEFDEAEDYVTALVTKGTYKDDFAYSNWLQAIRSRIKDHKLIRSTLINKGKQIEDRVETKLERERFKAIELIGVFTAIIAFIFTTISFTKSFSFRETILLEITAGLILILFVLILSLIFQKSKRKVIGDIRFYSVLIICTALLLVYILN